MSHERVIRKFFFKKMSGGTTRHGATAAIILKYRKKLFTIADEAYKADKSLGEWYSLVPLNVRLA